MSKRIFTKIFSGTIDLTTTSMTVRNAKESWLAQEDIEVIGAEVAIQSQMPSENDGFSQCFVELSQVGVFGQEGAILGAWASEGWNTTPAGIMATTGHIVVMFPQGYVVPVKEEGYLHVNTRGWGKSAGTDLFEYEIYVYYTKGRSR
ncbi:hypothetical protein ES708_29258 [subsurface metagenome]